MDDSSLFFSLSLFLSDYHFHCLSFSLSILLTVFLTHSFIINHFHTKKDLVTYLTKCVTGQNSVRGLKVCPGHGVRYHPRVRPFQPVTPLTVLQGAIVHLS